MTARSLPDDETMLRLHRQGKTHSEIARAYGVSRAAVSQWFLKRGLQMRPAKRHEKYLPWTLTQDDLMHYAARMLRLAGRIEAGDDVSDRDRSKFEHFRTHILGSDTVIAYDRENGFHAVTREEIDGDGLIRQPVETDVPAQSRST